MKNNRFAVLDLGSSGFECALLDIKGNIVKSLKKSIKPKLPREGFLEYDSEEILKVQVALLDKIIANGKPLGIGIASQRSTVVLWDKKTGKTLCPVLSWQDARATSELGNLAISQKKIHKITGLYKTPYYSAPKISWCLKNFPSVKSALKKNTLLCGSLPTYLIWYLTRGKTFAIDPTLAQRTLLFDINKFDWNKDLLSAFNIPRRILPQVSESVGNFGIYKNIPVIAMVGDQQSALAGVEAFDKGDAMINYGSGAFLLVNTGNEKIDIPGLLTSVNWQNSSKKTYSLEGTINSAGSMFDWLKKLGFDFDIKKLDYYCAHSDTNPFVLPALGGIGAPYWDFNTEVVMAGLTPQTKKEDIVKATLQGIAFLASDIFSKIGQSGIEIKEVKASGGLSASDYLLDFQSDLIQVPVTRVGERETIKGVFNLMSKYLGIAQQKITKQTKKFIPKLTPSQSQKLIDCWIKFLNLSRQIYKI